MIHDTNQSDVHQSLAGPALWLGYVTRPGAGLPAGLLAKGGRAGGCEQPVARPSGYGRQARPAQLTLEPGDCQCATHCD